MKSVITLSHGPYLYCMSSYAFFKPKCFTSKFLISFYPYETIAKNATQKMLKNNIAMFFCRKDPFEICTFCQIGMVFTLKSFPNRGFDFLVNRAKFSNWYTNEFCVTLSPFCSTKKRHVECWLQIKCVDIQIQNNIIFHLSLSITFISDCFNYNVHNSPWNFPPSCRMWMWYLFL